MIDQIVQRLSHFLGYVADNKNVTSANQNIQIASAEPEVRRQPPTRIANITSDIGNIVSDQSIEEHISPSNYRINVGNDGTPRYIGYTVSGNRNAHKILLCLPGLLETKDSFSILHAYFLRFKEVQVISVDFSGRGDSDPLPDAEQYLMSLYLSDACKLINGIIFSGRTSNVELTILGTSMGGVLAMYLTQAIQQPIHQIILNDVALTVNWTALFNLYKSMNNEVGYMEVRQLAQTLKVNERAISDVQLPGHFDLPYRVDVWGMNFHDAISRYTGKVCLIYGGDSKICTKRRVEEAVEFLPSLQTFCVEGAGHPAPYDLSVCEFIQDELEVTG